MFLLPVDDIIIRVRSEISGEICQSVNEATISRCWATDGLTDLLVVRHQHQLDVFGLSQDVSPPLQTEPTEVRGQSDDVNRTRLHILTVTLISSCFLVDSS